MDKQYKIIVRLPNWVGDCAMGTCVLRCLRNARPDAHITYMLKDYVVKLLENAPWYDDLFLYEPDDKHSGVIGYSTLIRELRQQQYDLGILLPNSFSSALMFKPAGVRRRVGYERDNRGWLLTDPIKPPTKDGKFDPQYMGDYYINILHQLDINCSDNHSELRINDDSVEQCTELFIKHRIKTDNDRPLVAISPGAKYGSSKLWVHSNYAAVADRLIKELNAEILILAGPEEEKLIHSIHQEMSLPATLLMPDEVPLDVLKAIIKRINLFITVDSGPRHIAAAFDVPTIVLMGPTNPAYARADFQRSIDLSANVECAPCQKKMCPRDHKCMTSITPDMVFDAAVKMLNS